MIVQDIKLVFALQVSVLFLMEIVSKMDVQLIHIVKIVIVLKVLKSVFNVLLQLIEF